MKRLIGRTDMEDALKRLDKLTQEEVRMAVAENLKATHAVDERVRGVARTVGAIDNKVVGVDDNVAIVKDNVATVKDDVATVKDDVAIVKDSVVGVSDRVAAVDDRVAGVDNKMASVDDRLKVVDDKVDEVIHGARIIFSQFPEPLLSSELLRRKGSNHSHAASSQ
jgi:archaellum component FlaC